MVEVVVPVHVQLDHVDHAVVQTKSEVVHVLVVWVFLLVVVVVVLAQVEVVVVVVSDVVVVVASVVVVVAGVVVVVVVVVVAGSVDGQAVESSNAFRKASTGSRVEIAMSGIRSSTIRLFSVENFVLGTLTAILASTCFPGITAPFRGGPDCATCGNSALCSAGVVGSRAAAE